MNGSMRALAMCAAAVVVTGCGTSIAQNAALNGGLDNRAPVTTATNQTQVSSASERSTTQGAAAPGQASVQPGGNVFTFTGQPAWTAQRVQQSVPPVFVGSAGFAAIDGRKESEIVESAGGERWTKVAALSGQVAALSFANLQDGVAVIVSASEPTTGTTTPAAFSIAQTTDGGRTWRTVWRQSGAVSNSVNALQAWAKLFGSMGYVVVNGQLLKTTDGGYTWKPVSIPGRVLDGSAPAANDLWLTTTSARADIQTGRVQLLHSADGGAHVQAVLTTQPMQVWEANVAFDATGDGVVLIKDLGTWQTRVEWTTDGGRHWRTAIPDVYQGRVLQSVPVIASGVAYIGECPYAAPFPGGITSFNLATGEAATVCQAPGWYAVSLSQGPGGQWYAAPQEAQGTGLYLSPRGLADWQRVAPAGAPTIQAVFFDPGTASATSAASEDGIGIDADAFNGYIEVSHNGGRTWNVVKRLPGETPIAVARGPASEVAVAAVQTSLATGQSALHMWLSRDGGATWADLGPSQLPKPLSNSIPSDIPIALQVVQGGYRLALGAYPDEVELASADGVHWKVAYQAPNSASTVLPAFDGNALWFANEIVLKPGSKVDGKTIPPVQRPVLERVENEKVTRRGALPEGYTPLAMAWSGNRGWVFCTSSAVVNLAQNLSLFVTTDGGATWSRWTMVPNAAAEMPETLDSLWFTNAKDGYLLTSSGLLQTSDGGHTWQYANA